MLFKYEIMIQLLFKLFVFFLIVITLPFQLLIIVFIFISSGSPIFYRQLRLGKAGKKFKLYKFRTMVREADKLQQRFASKNEANGPVFKIRNDPRFTKIGKFLSHTGLDELPQLFNVLNGDMALIGPRPLPINEAKKLKLWMRQREKIKPGIISPWILEGYHRRSFDEWMKSDVVYAGQKSLTTDISLTIRTIGFLLGLFWREIFKF